jgi:hypothetical protein
MKRIALTLALLLWSALAGAQTVSSTLQCDTYTGSNPVVSLGFTGTTGRTILVAANADAETFTSVTDDSSGTPAYTRDLSTENISGPDTGIWRRTNISGSPTALNFTKTGTGNLWVCAIEVSGLDNSSPLDDSEEFSTIGDNTAHSQSYTATAAGSLAFSIMVNGLDFQAASGSTVMREVSAGAAATIAAAYQVFVGTGTQTINYTVNPSSTVFTAGALYKAAAGGGGIVCNPISGRCGTVAPPIR